MDLIAFIVFIIIAIFCYIKLSERNKNCLFENKYNYLVKEMEDEDGPTENMLCVIILYPLYKMYYDKKSCFYLNNSRIFFLFCFLYSTIMISPTIENKHKERIFNNIKKSINIFNEIMKIDVLPLVHEMHKNYEALSFCKQDVLNYFINTILRDNMSLEQQTMLIMECKIFFIEMFPPIIDGVKEWCIKSEEHNK